MSLGCVEVKEKLSEYIDDMLSQSEKEAVAEHIGDCAECAREYSELKSIVGELCALPSEALPSDFFDKVDKRLGKRKKRLFFAQAARGFSAIAAGLMLLLLLRTGYYGNINRIKTAYVDDASFDFRQEDTAQEAPSAPQNQPDAQQNAPAEASPDTGFSSTKTAQAPKAAVRQTPQPSVEQPEAPDNDAPDNAESEPQPQTQEPALAGGGSDMQADAFVSQYEAPAASARMAQPQESAIMHRIFADEGKAEKAAESADAEPAPNALPSFSASSHDMDEPQFVSVIIRVADFEGAAAVLKEKYNAEITDGVISLKLNNEDFQNVMDLMLDYQGRVQQRETKEPLTYNECIIVPD